jgi:hypothetical protein
MKYLYKVILVWYWWKSKLSTKATWFSLDKLDCSSRYVTIGLIYFFTWKKSFGDYCVFKKIREI